MSTSRSEGDFIIIGLDFGTTYSGIAWAYSKYPEEITAVRSWNAEFSYSTDAAKAPTQLFYSSGSDTSWGYSVPADRDALKWFKLLLIDEKDITGEVASCSQLLHSRELLKTMKKDPVDVIGCFLRHIWNHAIDCILRSIGSELLQKSRFHVVVTLPAIWPYYARRRMQQAVSVSGILGPRPCGDTTFCFIHEPEAAALATMKEISKRSTMEARDTIIVCDAGGGTVDLTSYVITSTNPFDVKQCARVDGDLCGGVFLDEQFLKLINRKATPGSWEGVSIAEQRKFLNDVWEHGIKKRFSNQRRPWPVTLPNSCRGSTFTNEQERTIVLSSYDIRTAYDPIITKIEALVIRQNEAIISEFEQPAKYIVLVGGLGLSPYLFDRLQMNVGLTVLQPQGDNTWAAICRGAVIHGTTNYGLPASLGVANGARIALNSYGVSSSTPFRPGKHLESEKYWSDNHKMWKVNRMEWFIREGDNMLTKGPVRHKFLQLCSGRIGEIQNYIYSCSESVPPKVLPPGVQPLCVIRWTRDTDIESLPRYTNPLGKILHKLDYEIEMTWEDGTVDFTVYFEGRRVGARNVNIQFR